MNLLIVDDQKAVADGLRDGIEWHDIGFDGVFTAYSAAQAREIFLNYDINVLLCDIQMPVESGISLVQWVREKNYEVECIFLTAYSEFEYAKEAIKLNSFDYILQPAPYHEIEVAVEKAAGRLSKNIETKKLKNIAERIIENTSSLRERMIGGYVFGAADKNFDNQLIDLKVMDGFSVNGYAAMIQVVRWRSAYDIWEPELLQYVLINVTSELCESYGQELFLYRLDEYSFLGVLFGKDGHNIDIHDVRRIFEQLKKVFDDYIKCDLAIYIDRFSDLEKLSEERIRLLKMSENNVSLESNVFLYESPDDNVYEDTFEKFPEIWNWKNQLKSGFFDTTRIKIMDYIDTLARKKILTKDVLMSFYHEILQMYYTYFLDNGLLPHEVYHNKKELEVINKGYSSIEGFREMINLLTKRCVQLLEDKEPTAEGNMVDLIKKYVQKNLDKNILISDISSAVHLSKNHTSKVFRKGTGKSLKEYIIEEKINTSEALLKTTNLPVGTISSMVGYDNFSHFSTLYKKIKGISPSDVRRIQSNEAENF